MHGEIREILMHTSKNLAGTCLTEHIQYCGF